jgi:hypothetical protein
MGFGTVYLVGLVLIWLGTYAFWILNKRHDEKYFRVAWHDIEYIMLSCMLPIIWPLVLPIILLVVFVVKVILPNLKKFVYWCDDMIQGKDEDEQDN